MKKTIAFLLALTLVLSFASVSLAESTIDTIMTVGTTQAFTDATVSEEDLTLILKAGLAAESAINQQPWYFVAITNQEVMASITGSGFGGATGASFTGMPKGATDGASMPEGTTTGAEGAPAGFEGSSGMPAGGSTGFDGFSGMPAGVPAGMGGSIGSKASLGDSPVAIIIYMNEATSSPNASFDCGLAVQNMYIAAASLGYGVKIVSSPTSTLNGANHDALCAQLGVDPSMKAVAVLLIGYAETGVDATTSATTRSELSEKVSIIK